MRSIAAMLPTGQSRVITDIGDRLEFKHFQMLAVLTGGMFPTCLCESAWFFMPITLMYQFVLSFDMVADYYEISGQDDHLNFVFKEKILTVIRLTLI